MRISKQMEATFDDEADILILCDRYYPTSKLPIFAYLSASFITILKLYKGWRTHQVLGLVEHDNNLKKSAGNYNLNH
jgi:hypothetical protein